MSSSGANIANAMLSHMAVRLLIAGDLGIAGGISEENSNLST
jgi:hypothetical protein